MKNYLIKFEYVIGETELDGFDIIQVHKDKDKEIDEYFQDFNGGLYDFDPLKKYTYFNYNIKINSIELIPAKDLKVIKKYNL